MKFPFVLKLAVDYDTWFFPLEQYGGLGWAGVECDSDFEIRFFIRVPHLHHSLYHPFETVPEKIITTIQNYVSNPFFEIDYQKYKSEKES